ncbi:mannitol dehydrogenase family protein [Lutimonas sp.]|uniref:mannitol dehydrogenase family protein n=1 Tax=Lutimonas sp. TaxID=1872403 RepID=UPI003D9AF132
MDKNVEINTKNLAQINQIIPGPSYDREKLPRGIVHIGVGGFHRAHQAYYVNQLNEKHSESKWRIIGVGLRQADVKIGQVMQEQNGLYTLLIKHPDGKIQPQIIGSIIDFKLSLDQSKEIIDAMAALSTEIVSLTITEGGYNFDPSTGNFDFENEAIQYELEHPDDPKTVYGYLTAALNKRRLAQIPAFTVISCDNIQHNGDLARNMLLAFAKKQNAVLATWIEKEVRFPNSMVDRITPVTSQTDIDYLAANYGIKDAWPVTCEPFIQWVVEDRFSMGRPSLEKVGVQFVKDVKPYEKMKLRLLNAGHSVLGILGAIHGHQTINACMDDKTFVLFLKSFLDTEASAVLGELKGINLSDYKNSLLERFSNPNIKDSVSRICSESSAKLPKFLIATLQENLQQGGGIQLATLVVAAWCYYSDKGIDEKGQEIEVIDALKKELHLAASDTEKDVFSFIRQKSIFGKLHENEKFRSVYQELIKRIYEEQNIREIMQGMISS